jgi:hypothetical protein
MSIKQNVVNSNDYHVTLISGFSLQDFMISISGIQNLNNFEYEVEKGINEIINNNRDLFKFKSNSEFFINEKYEIRCTMAINIKIGDYYYLVKRSEAIYISGEPIDKQVNLGQLDCLIASRVFLPSGENYGLFGKAELTRNNQDLFSDLEFDFKVSDYVATEYNTETEENSVMICAEMDILNASVEFIETLENSENIVKVKISDFNPDETNSTAKLIACTK